MPAFAPTPNAEMRVRRGDARRRDAVPSRSLALQLRVAVKRDVLDRQLADGTNPESTPELTLRAAQLTSSRNRRRIARALRQVIADAYHRPFGRSRIVVIRRDAVLEAQEAIETLIERIESPTPVQAQGMALVERILTDSQWSPLYNRADAGALRHVVFQATDALDPQSGADRELAIAA